MELQLKIRLGLMLIIILLASCQGKNDIEGNWGAIDCQKAYAELFIKDGRIKIFHEATGFINPQTYTIKDDSLITNVLSYKIEFITPDSLNLTSGTFSLYLKRLNEGFLLSDLTGDKEQEFTEKFRNRMFKRKGINPDSLFNSKETRKPSIKEEIIEF